MPYLVVLIFVILMIAFFVYSGIAIQHAARFRYVSQNTVRLTLVFTATAAVLICAAVWALVKYLFAA